MCLNSPLVDNPKTLRPKDMDWKLYTSLYVNCVQAAYSIHQCIDGVTCMFINKASARDWFVDMYELTQHPYNVEWFNPASSNVWQGF